MNLPLRHVNVVVAVGGFPGPLELFFFYIDFLHITCLGPFPSFFLYGTLAGRGLQPLQ